VTDRHRRSWARWLEAILWLAGVTALAWVTWGWLDARLYQQREERLLEAALAAPSAAAAEQPVAMPSLEGEPGIPADELPGALEGTRTDDGASADFDGAGDASNAPRTTASGAAVRAAAAAGRTTAGAGVSRASLGALGRITVPRLGLAVMVADGIDARTLRRAVGHIPGTSRLGSGGNVGLAGHRDSFFRPLKDVRPGDEVVVTTPGAISRYRVEWAEVVPPSDTRSLRSTTYPALTLVTCHPFHYVGTAPDRFVVRARLVESRAPTAADAAAPEPARRGR
jgi:sortase A